MCPVSHPFVLHYDFLQRTLLRAAQPQVISALSLPQLLFVLASLCSFTPLVFGLPTYLTTSLKYRGKVFPLGVLSSPIPIISQSKGQPKESNGRNKVREEPVPYSLQKETVLDLLSHTPIRIKLSLPHAYVILHAAAFPVPFLGCWEHVTSPLLLHDFLKGFLRNFTCSLFLLGAQEMHSIKLKFNLKILDEQ